MPSSTEWHSYILSIQNGRKHSLLQCNCCASLIFETFSILHGTSLSYHIVKPWSREALWPCFRHLQQWILGVLPLDGLMIIRYSMSMLSYPFHTVTHFIEMIAKYLLGSSEVPHKCLWSEWWQKLPTYVMIMLVGFRDTFIITKPIGIAWSTEKILLFCSKFRYSKHWLFSLSLS